MRDLIILTILAATCAFAVSVVLGGTKMETVIFSVVLVNNAVLMRRK